MTVEPGAGQAVVKIRTPGHFMIQTYVMAGVFLVLATFVGFGGDQLGLGRLWLAGAGLLVAEGLWIRTWSIDLTPETANIRGARRRSIPWGQVQAVLRHEQIGQDRVSLVLEDGKRVTLRAPSTWWGLGGAAFERDFHRIGQWWLAHRGESWRPVRPEAPRPPVTG